VLVLTARLCYLVIRFHGPTGPVKRPHLEAAALLLAIAGLMVRFAIDVPEAKAASPARPPFALWLGLVAAALMLYWPALHVGLLSDDFILFQHAQAWDVSQVAPQLFRPLPIFVWAVVLHLGGGPTMLHVVNILLHATNAYLAGCVAAGWVPGRWWPTAAAVLVLVAPLGPEAVAWCAGTFDLFATAFVLWAVLIARRSDPGLRHRIQLIAVSLAALLSKETAVVLPLLLVVDALARRTFSRAFVVTTAIVATLAVVFGAIRLQSATAVETSGFTRYRVQRLLFDSFGALGAPWHMNDPALVVVRTGYALCVIVLIAAFFVNRGPRWASVTVLGGTCWVLVSILPLLAFFYVGSQLEASRYLYLAACGWSAILVAAAADLADRFPGKNTLLRGALVALIATGAWGARQHLRPWMHAAAVRDTVLGAAAADSRLHACSPAYVEGLPDSVDGAYLFANGAREALADVGVAAFARRGSGECAFQWDPSAARFNPASAPAR
jgi:hypothetical protein